MEKRIKLSDEQRERLWNTKNAMRMHGKIMADMLVEIAERAAQDEQDFWDEVRNLAGIDRHQVNVKVSWVGSCIIVDEDSSR